MIKGSTASEQRNVKTYRSEYNSDILTIFLIRNGTVLFEIRQIGERR